MAPERLDAGGVADRSRSVGRRMGRRLDRLRNVGRRGVSRSDGRRNGRKRAGGPPLSITNTRTRRLFGEGSRPPGPHLPGLPSGAPGRYHLRAGVGMIRETFPLPGGQLEAVAVGRVLYVLPAIVPTMPTRLRRLLELRREAAITGTCPRCSAALPSVPVHDGGTMRLEHERWCPVSDPALAARAGPLVGSAGGRGMRDAPTPASLYRVPPRDRCLPFSEIVAPRTTPAAR